MTTTGAQAWVADLYDDYVTTSIDVPFLLQEAQAAAGPVLELMAGTGRVSLPLAEAGVALTCVDLSGPMLVRLRIKLAERGLAAETVEMDVTRLALPRRGYALALLPFQSFAELLTPEDQRAALAAIAAHLAPGGRFVCTLHNPPVRRRTVDGQMRLVGTFPLSGRGATLLLWSLQQALPTSRLLKKSLSYGFQDGIVAQVEVDLDLKSTILNQLG
jgi:SAM-dependent methyltransferase